MWYDEDDSSVEGTPPRQDSSGNPSENSPYASAMLVSSGLCSPEPREATPTIHAVTESLRNLCIEENSRNVSTFLVGFVHAVDFTVAVSRVSL